MDLNNFEIDALSKASDMGGEYLESIGVVPPLTGEQWRTFVKVICLSYHMELSPSLFHLTSEQPGVK